MITLILDNKKKSRTRTWKRDNYMKEVIQSSGSLSPEQYMEREETSGIAQFPRLGGRRVRLMKKLRSSMMEIMEAAFLHSLAQSAPFSHGFLDYV